MTPSPDALGDAGPRKTKSWRKKFAPRTVTAGILTCIGYYLGAKLGFALTFQPHPVSVMWPPNSILLAALLLTPTRSWWFLLLCALPAHLASQMQSGVPPTMMLCWFVSNSCEALIGASLTRAMVTGPFRFVSLRHVSVYLICGVFLGPFLSSFLDGAFVKLNHWGQGAYGEIWRIRFFSNALTAAALAPALVTSFTSDFESIRKEGAGRYLEAAVVALGTLVVGFEVFIKFGTGPGSEAGLLYAPLPFLLWAAVRFGPAGASLAMFVTALIAIWGASHGQGPFSALLAEANALSLQLFLIVSAILMLLLATVIKDRERAEERFTKAFHSSPDAMLISRVRDGDIIEVNECWESMLGYQREDVVGKTLLELNIYASEPDRERLTARTSEPGRQRDIEMLLRTKAGELLQTLISADTEEIGGEKSLIVIVRDITERRQAEEARHALAHASRLAMVGELTALIAHQINQPLGAILSNAETAELLLQRKEPQLDQVRRILSDIRNADIKAAETIRGIRNLLRKRDVAMQSLDLNEPIGEVLRLVQSDALVRRVKLHSQLEWRLPRVLADRVLMQQVILNLILNGIEAMQGVSESKRQLTVQTRKNNGAVEVSVSDTGEGIAPEKQARLFDSFFTTKKDGMGLGLAIARSIIDTHSGKIWVESNPLGGATFRFSIPAESAESQGKVIQS